MSKYFILRFEAPLQSYSCGGTMKLRETSQFPTKSAVVGILGCAFGIDRKNVKGLSELSQSFSMAVRADKDIRKIKDFQTVDVKHKEIGINKGISVEAWKNGYIPNKDKKERGKEKDDIYKGDKDLKTIRKEYLSDAGFTVLLSGSDEFLDKCDKALRNPKWVCSLGRSSCLPSRPIFASKTEIKYVEAESFKEAMKQVPLIEKASNHGIYMVEEEITDLSNLEFGTYRRQYDNVLESTVIGALTYGERLIRNYNVEVDN